MSYYVEPISLTAEIEARLADKADALTVRMTVGELRAIVAALKAETARADRYAERLEITSHWVSYDDGATLTRVEVPREDWDGQHDGIDCRDETIKLQDAAVDNLRAQLTAATDKLASMGWRTDWENAPKDGSWIIGLTNHGAEPCYWITQDDPDEEYGSAEWGRRGGFRFRLVAWMQIPDTKESQS